MKKQLSGLATGVTLVLGVAGNSVQAAPYWNLPELIKTPSDAVFAPPGFDDNDNAQIVVHGDLLSTCYKAAPPEVTVDKAGKQVTVSAQAYLYKSDWCIPVLTPYTQTIDLGLLPSAKYRIVELNKDGRVLHEAMLPIAVAKVSAPDDNLYAPVKNARMDLTASGHVLVLSGMFNSTCMEMQEVKVLHRVANLFEVLPMANYKASENCQNIARPFEVRVDLPVAEPGETLIHVRSLNGQSVNDVELF